MRKLTNVEFLDKLNSIHGDEYTPLEEYQGARVKIKIRHNICGKTLYTTPDNLYNGGCIFCGYEKAKMKQRKTHECFLDEVKQKYDGEYELVDRYVNNTTKLKFYHKKCDCYFYATPRDFLQGKAGCPKCRYKRSSENINKDNEYFLKHIPKGYLDKYEILSQYKNARTKIKIRCKKCNDIFYSIPSHIYENKGCRKCALKEMGISRRKSHEEFVNQLGKKWFDEYELLDRYVEQKRKVTVKHKKCGKIFKAYSYQLTCFDSGCPRCKESKGEKAISRFLDKHGIEYIPQYKFEDCVYKSQLPFDFALIKNGSPYILIEYQGIQHFEPIDFFGGKKALKNLKIRDKIKREYAKSKNIKFIEIKYNENINDVLSKSIPR